MQHGVRRVGFRSGTDEELAAMHAVESVVDAERRPDRLPQPLDSYMAFARNLPSQFDDHTWIAEAKDGPPLASAACWSNAAGDPRVMECDVCVLREHRRRRIGTALMRAIAEETARDGRSLLTWATFDRVPAGAAFSERIGGRAAKVDRMSELQVAAVDWATVARWDAAEEARRRGYSLEMLEGVFPEHLRDDAATLHHIMQTAPRDDLDVGGVMIDAAFVAELDRALTEAGRQRWTCFVRDSDGNCVGGTEVTFEPWEPAIALQQNTGIDPDHRGLGLAKWAKAAMLARIRRERPEVRKIRTGNAFSNAPMLAINDALGFAAIATKTEWQANVDDVLAGLDDLESRGAESRT